MEETSDLSFAGIGTSRGSTAGTSEISEEERKIIAMELEVSEARAHALQQHERLSLRAAACDVLLGVSQTRVPRDGSDSRPFCSCPSMMPAPTPTPAHGPSAAPADARLNGESCELDEWSCSRCTLINSGASAICEVCGGARCDATALDISNSHGDAPSRPDPLAHPAASDTALPPTAETLEQQEREEAVRCADAAAGRMLDVQRFAAPEAMFAPPRDTPLPTMPLEYPQGRGNGWASLVQYETPPPRAEHSPQPLSGPVSSYCCGTGE